MIVRALNGTLLESLTKGSKVKVLCLCDSENCSSTWETNYCHAAKRAKHYCKFCIARRPRAPKTEAHRKALSESVKKSVKFKQHLARVLADPKHLAKRSEVAKARHASGALKASPLTPESRAKLSRSMMGNTNASGESGGFCKWYEIENNGAIEKVQGTWEFAYAKFLIKQKVAFKCHPSPVLYVDSFGKTRRYFPDFQILGTGEYIDVKNPFCLEQDQEKLKAVFLTGINLKIVTEEDLKALNLL